MPRPFYIIDGYNLMHAAGLARERYGPGDLERCRNQFLNLLARRLPERERRRTTVVFDAATAPSDLPRTFDVQGMEVRFAATGGDADSLIEELIARHSAPRQVCVVSGDHRLQRAARRRGGSFVESAAFADRLGNSPRSPHRQAHRPNRKLDDVTGDTAYWLGVFANAGQTEKARDDIPPPTAPAAVGPAAPETTHDNSAPQSAYSEEELEFWQRRVDELTGDDGTWRD